MFELISQNFYLGLIIILIFSAIVGSFLNVVIYRLPQMLFHEFELEARSYLKLPVAVEAKRKINLAWPRSFCTQCHQTLPWLSNIPVFSYLALRGRCYYCREKIPVRYLWVEIITIVSSVLVYYFYGLSAAGIAGLCLSWFLISICFIDLEHQLVPDPLTYSALWLGLLINTQAWFCSLSSAVIAAIVAYLSLWLIAQFFRLIRKKEGIGYGDFKVFAMLGAWFGLSPLIYLILIASLTGLAVAVFLLVAKKMQYNQPLAFAPYLALAGYIYLLIQGSSFSGYLMHF